MRFMCSHTPCNTRLALSAASAVCRAVLCQVGISDSWLQLSHMLAVFGAREQLQAPVVAAMWKRLAGG